MTWAWLWIVPPVMLILGGLYLMDHRRFFGAGLTIVGVMAIMYVTLWPAASESSGDGPMTASPTTPAVRMSTAETES